MLELTLQETRFYQEAKAEGRKEGETEILKLTVPLLLKAGMTIEQIAQQLNVDIEAVQSATVQISDGNK
jgi:predicted transposase YdaD